MKLKARLLKRNSRALKRNNPCPNKASKVHRISSYLCDELNTDGDKHSIKVPYTVTGTEELYILLKQ